MFVAEGEAPMPLSIWVHGLALAALVSSAPPHPVANESAAGVREFLVDRDTGLVALVTVRDVQRRWVILESDGDHIPLVISECEMVEPYAGSGWATKTRAAVMQFDYTEMISGAIAPPVMEGRRYLLWADPSPADSEIPAEAPWTAHPQGFLLVRGSGKRAFVYWNGERYTLASIRTALKAGPMPLDQIVDPLVRLSVAERRLTKKSLGDATRFLEGLLKIARDPESEAKRVVPMKSAEPGADLFGMAAGEARPHALWFKSMEQIQSVGEIPAYREQVVAALKPLLDSGPENRRLIEAIVLAELGSDLGHDVLVGALKRPAAEEVSRDSDGGLTFPGRFAFDGSAPAAAAHALARVGDRRGLKHTDENVRLAAADALVEKPDEELKQVLTELAEAAEAEVVRQRASGELTASRKPGDHTRRYSETWVRARGLLARIGDDASFRALVDALLDDMATYPDAPETLVPMAQVMTWSQGSTLGGMVRAAEPTSSQVLERIERLYGKEDGGSGNMHLLREALREPVNVAERNERPPAPTDAEIEKRIASASADTRAEGLAAAGLYDRDPFYGRVLETARHGTGVERQAALYSLGLYRRVPPQDVLRELVATGQPMERFTALELATRTHPERFAGEAVTQLRLMLAAAAAAPEPSYEQQHDVTFMTRVISRMVGSMPADLVAALRDKDAEVRRAVVVAIGMGGNPAAAPLVQPLAQDPDPRVRAAVESSLRLLGPQAP
jgi:HEAT repeat protein